MRFKEDIRDTGTFYVLIGKEISKGVEIPEAAVSLVLAFQVSILITLILKITTIYFSTNDLLECVANLSKIHKTQVGKDQIK